MTTAAPAVPATPARRKRLTRAARREQLIDAAADLWLRKGQAAVTMERVAEWAGVSKALPYTHFDNADAVLVAVYERETGRLAQRVLDALAGAPAGADPVDVTVRAFFTAVMEQGELLKLVAAPGSAVAEMSDGGRRVGPEFATQVLVDELDLPRPRARAAASVVLAILSGAVDAWEAGEGSRRTLERVAARAIRGAVGAPLDA